MSKALRWLFLVAAGFVLGVVAVGFVLTPDLPACALAVESVFSPDAQSEAVALLASAKSSISIELYQFSNAELKAALVDAVNRGVDVKLILESRIADNFKTAEFLNAKGVKIRWAPKSFTLVHSKFAVIDGVKVLVGSHNWSFNAWNVNREASVIVYASAVASEFGKVFEDDWSNGVDYAS